MLSRGAPAVDLSAAAQIARGLSYLHTPPGELAEAEQGPAGEEPSGASPPQPDVKALAEALRESRGNMAKAARQSGISYQRLARLMKKYEFTRAVRRILHRPEIVERDVWWKAGERDLAEALARHGGRRDLSAKELGMRPRTVGERVRFAHSDSPLKPFQERPAVVRRSDGEIAEALARHNGSRTMAAKDLQMSQNGVSERIMSAGRHSPLYRFVRVKGQPPLFERRVSEGEIAAALQRSGGDRTRAARAVGMTPKTIIYRIKHARGGPLEEFKEIKGRGGRRPIRSNEEIAQALAASGGNKMMAARTLAMPTSTLVMRVRNAKADSVLARFR